MPGMPPETEEPQLPDDGYYYDAAEVKTLGSTE